MKKSMLSNGAILAAFAVVTTGLIGLTYSGTESTIDHQQRLKVKNTLSAILPSNRYNNDIINDCTFVTAPDYLGSELPQRVYRGRLNDEPSVLAIETVAPNGYSGRISLIVGLRNDATITGVRVLEHKETPGLGDKIDIRVSDWITSFEGKTIEEDTLAMWAVRKDGGQFDQFTGATITPRAVVAAVKLATLYAQQNQAELFDAANTCAFASSGTEGAQSDD